MISFISSLASYVSCPFLIVTTSAALYSWDEEFLHLAPSVYAVVYHGNKHVRKSIRTLEFYEEGGCIMFQILITAPEIIAEVYLCSMHGPFALNYHLDFRTDLAFFYCLLVMDSWHLLFTSVWTCRI